MNYIKGVIDKKAEIDNIKSKKYNDDAKEETIVIIKEYNNNIDFYVDIKKADSFLVLDNLKFWLIKIIEDVRNEQKINAPKKKIISNLILPKPTKKTSYKSPKKSSSSFGLYLSNNLSIAPPKIGNFSFEKFLITSMALYACSSVNPSAIKRLISSCIFFF